MGNPVIVVLSDGEESALRELESTVASSSGQSLTRCSPGVPPLKSPDMPYTSPMDAVRNHYKGLPKFLSPQEHVPPAPTANLIQLYYAYFHAAHPFVLPPAYLIKTPAQMLKHLLPSMRFMGSFFAQNAHQRTFRDSAEGSLFRQGAPRNAWTVQALLLFAIGLHANNEQERAGQVKDVAVEMALELGMNYEEFAVTAGVSGVSSVVPRRLDEDFARPPVTTPPNSNPILEESWRRTWWELYFLDGLMAGIHQRDQFRLWTVECTVPLPCEELAYNTGQVPTAFSLQEFDNRYFAAEDTVFSSFSYRVEAVRILGQVLAAQAAGSDTDAADQSIVNWFLHLPEAKKELVGKDGKVDEMLFQAHMIIHATTIYLHRPRSHLIFSIIPDDTFCTPQNNALSTSAKPQIFHTSRALKAADSISRLLTLPTPLIKHTPFFTCITTLAAISHLSACSWILYGDEGYLAKERIRLAVGALKTMETAWPVSAFVLQQVKLIAREVFRLPRPMGADGGGFITEEEMIRFIEEEKAVDGVEEGGLVWGGEDVLLSEMVGTGRIMGAGIGVEGEAMVV